MMRKSGKTRIIFSRHDFSKRQLIILVLISAIGAFSTWIFYEVLFTKPSDDWFESIARNSSLVTLPKDDTPHYAEMEWWYYNGYLNTDSGKQYSFHYTVFLLNNVAHHMVSHASINDYQTGKYLTAQRRTAGNPSKSKENGFEFIQGNWLMTGGNGVDQLKFNIENISLELNVVSTQPPIIHGGNGVILLKDAGDSYYYSRSRMKISGVLKIGNTVEKVTGISWFDHQWGDFSVGQLTWDWFSLQLSDSIDLMIYQLRDKKTSEKILYMGTFNQNGNVETLSAEDFNVIPKKEWTSKKTNIVYPTEWNIEIPSKNIRITIKSRNESNEFDAKLTTYNIYWEGAVSVQGTHTGFGFMELYYMNEKNSVFR
ncbi:MAG: hypothetical protein KF839_12445 [Nitrosomonas sp.]|nr:hypothetical protein [Nitrosomonas sp.]